MSYELANFCTLQTAKNVPYKKKDKENKRNRRKIQRRWKRRQRLRPVKSLIIVGDQTTAANSPIKGYVRTPIRDVIDKLRQQTNCDVIDFDEFRTTQLCSFCWERAKTSTTPDRFQQCKRCAGVSQKRKVTTATF